MNEKFLDTIYQATSQDQINDAYAKWAQSYDNEVGENGYATPARLARALMKHLKAPDTTILDYGCGTGLSGVALREAGFTRIDGTDPSQEMIALAQEKGVYQNLNPLDLEADPVLTPGAYQVITAMGVIGTGAAPPETLNVVLEALPKDGICGFSFNDHTLEDPLYEGVLMNWLDCGAVRLLVKEYGPHLPARNINSNIYIVEKA